MDINNFIESTASGLRRIEPPDFLIIVDQYIHFYYDKETLCGIPVMHTFLGGYYAGYSDHAYPVIPCYKNISASKLISLINNFQRGFDDKADWYE